MKKIIKDWLTSAEGDLLLIREIIDLENLTHLSAFHAQQAIEKSFKAIIEEYELGFVKTHSLETLFNLVKPVFTIKIESDLLILLDQLYIDSRYPGEMGLLPDGKPSISESARFFKLAEKIYQAATSTCSQNQNV